MAEQVRGGQGRGGRGRGGQGRGGQGRVVLVTGASAGIGRACADRLAAAGWAVTGASRRGTSSGRWAGLVMNVDDDEAVAAGVRGILAEHGRIDAVVTAAGWGIAGAVEHTTVAEAKAQVETNFWGSVRTVQAVLGPMRDQGSGRVVLLSSIGGVLGIPFQAFYSASKFALEGLAEGLAYEVEPFGIHVTLVQPGNIATDFTASRQRAAAAAGDPVYAAALARAVGVMERDEANGAPADDVAAVVQRVLDARRPPRRVSVGKPGERFGLVARRFLPFRLFEAGAKGSLGVGLWTGPGRVRSRGWPTWSAHRACASCCYQIGAAPERLGRPGPGAFKIATDLTAGSCGEPVAIVTICMPARTHPESG